MRQWVSRPRSKSVRPQAFCRDLRCGSTFKMEEEMTDTEWFMQGKWIEYCNCDVGCPCEGMAPPSEGHCTGLSP